MTEPVLGPDGTPVSTSTPSLTPAPSAAPPGAATHSLLSSYATVQVLSPTVVNDVLYCTIQTQPSRVVASSPVQADIFNAGRAGAALNWFAHGIEEIMKLDHVIAGAGTQTIDTSGLLSDQVSFTVQYVAPGTSGTSVTAEAPVDASLLNQYDPDLASAGITQAEAIVAATYNNLKIAAGQ